MTSFPPNPRRALAIMAHPDDIEFMAGGLVSRWAREGVELHYCLLTDGSSGSRDPNLTGEALTALRRQEQQAAGQLFNVASYQFLGYTDGRLVDSITLRLQIAHAIRSIRPDAVLTCDPLFVYRSTYINHPDHRAAATATLAAIMPLANTLLAAPELTDEGLAPHDVSGVYLAAPAQATHWAPLAEEDFERQVAAMRSHTSQIGTWNFAQMLRGFADQAGREARDQGIECELAERYVYIDLSREERQPEK